MLIAPESWETGDQKLCSVRARVDYETWSVEYFFFFLTHFSLAGGHKRRKTSGRGWASGKDARIRRVHLRYAMAHSKDGNVERAVNDPPIHHSLPDTRNSILLLPLALYSPESKRDGLKSCNRLVLGTVFDKPKIWKSCMLKFNNMKRVSKKVAHILDAIRDKEIKLPSGISGNLAY